MRYSKSVQLEASNLIDAMRKGKVSKFDIDAFGLSDRDTMHRLVKLAREYGKIQTHACNGDLTERQQSREKNIENEIRTIVKGYCLNVHFDGDPRGFTVKLHAQTGNVYNTWGGKESGYGIGENE